MDDPKFFVDESISAIKAELKLMRQNLYRANEQYAATIISRVIAPMEQIIEKLDQKVRG